MKSLLSGNVSTIIRLFWASVWGAQLIAGALGASVKRATNREIGWFAVRNEIPTGLWPWSLFNQSTVVFHWHGEQFEIPDQAQGQLVSSGNANQGFAIGEKVIALQFHLEVTPQSVSELLSHAASDLTSGPFVQTPQAILQGVEKHAAASNAIMSQILDRWAKSAV